MGKSVESNAGLQRATKKQGFLLFRSNELLAAHLGVRSLNVQFCVYIDRQTKRLLLTRFQKGLALRPIVLAKTT